MSKMNYEKNNKFRNGHDDIRTRQKDDAISKFDKKWARKHRKKVAKLLNKG